MSSTTHVGMVNIDAPPMYGDLGWFIIVLQTIYMCVCVLNTAYSVPHTWFAIVCLYATYVLALGYLLKVCPCIPIQCIYIYTLYACMEYVLNYTYSTYIHKIHAYI